MILTPRFSGALPEALFALMHDLKLTLASMIKQALPQTCALGCSVVHGCVV